MPTFIKSGEEWREVDLLYIIPPQEGELNQYYGRIRNGKSYIACRHMYEDLKSGLIVKANFPFKWEGYDQRKVWYWLLLGLIGLKRNYYVYPKENFQQIDITSEWAQKNGYPDFHSWFAVQTSCKIYLDEGHLVYDSYQMTKMDLDKRVAIFDTGHYDRSISIISQRPSNIHATLRGNVNRFFKVEKLFNYRLYPTKIRLQKFQVTEFQDVGPDEKPDETRIIEDGEETDEYKHAVSQQTYWGRKKYFEMYNTKFRRGSLGESQKDNTKMYWFTWKEIVYNSYIYIKNIFSK